MDFLIGNSIILMLIGIFEFEMLFLLFKRMILLEDKCEIIRGKGFSNNFNF